MSRIVMGAGNPTTDQFLTLLEVRERFKVSRTTLWRWEQEHGLKVFRVGRTVRIRESDLQAFLHRHETSGTNADSLQSEAAPSEVRVTTE